MPHQQTAMGYRASVDAAGVMTIHDVPIFVACTRGDQVFDDEWIGKAVDKAKQAEGEGYLPPLHCGHHDAATRAGAKTVQSAGTFRVLGTQQIQFKGKARTAVLADLVITDESVQKAVLAQRLPYRSVEIFDVEAPPALDGLALLNHEAPFLELPMLLVNDVKECSNNSNLRPPWSVVHEGEETGDPVLALFRRGNSAFVLMKDNPPEGEPMSQAELFEKDEGDDEKKENMEDGGGALDATAVIKAISDGSISINDFDEIRAAMDSRGSEAIEEDEAALAPAPVPGAEAMKKEPAAMSAEFAAMQGKLDALTAKDLARDEADTRSNDVAQAIELLRDTPQGADLPAVLTAFHQSCKGDPVVWKAYIEARSMHAYGGATDSGSAERFAGQTSNMPDWAQKYLTDGGTSAADDAAKFCADWTELRGHGLATGQSQERYVELNMARIANQEA